MSRLTRFALVGTMLAGLLLLPTLAQASCYPISSTCGSLTVSNSSPRPGAAVTVSGSGFAARTPITITFLSSPVVIGKTSSDTAGNFSMIVRIPATARAGSHEIDATGLNALGQTRTLFASITVRGKALTTTGVNALPWIIVGAIVLVIGATLVGMGRRKKTTV